MRCAAIASTLLAGLTFLAAGRARAEDDVPERRPLSPREIEQWLDAPSPGDAPRDTPLDDAEAPPPRPRRHGITVESGVGALGHLGPLKHVSPTAPWFHLKLGFEPFSWLLLFAETDLSFATTRYANPPPQPRAYRLYGVGGGLRGTVPLSERFGVYVEGSLGAARVSEDVLEVYGYRDATEFQPYFGGRLGVDWYPVNPHLAISLHGGIRSYDQGLGRDRSSEPALAWVSGIAPRYTF